MSIEPYAVRTVCIRPVMPPKPAPKTLAPKLSMAEDAKRCNARMNRDRGCIEIGKAANANRMADAEARRVANANAVLALLKTGEFTRPEIGERLGLTENGSRLAVTRLRDEGRADFRKTQRGIAIWRAL